MIAHDACMFSSWALYDVLFCYLPYNKRSRVVRFWQFYCLGNHSLSLASQPVTVGTCYGCKPVHLVVFHMIHRQSLESFIIHVWSLIRSSHLFKCCYGWMLLWQRFEIWKLQKNTGTKFLPEQLRIMLRNKPSSYN